MNALKPKKGFVQDELNIKKLTPVQWDGIIRAMKRYAEHYHETMRANEFEKPKNFPITDVAGRSEQPCRYEPENTTTMNCKHCGEPVWMHKLA